jgi:hypothetical protein
VRDIQNFPDLLIGIPELKTVEEGVIMGIQMNRLQMIVKDPDGVAIIINIGINGYIKRILKPGNAFSDYGKRAESGNSII